MNLWYIYPKDWGCLWGMHSHLVPLVLPLAQPGASGAAGASSGAVGAAFILLLYELVEVSHIVRNTQTC
jgi:hypothetical protein